MISVATESPPALVRQASQQALAKSIFASRTFWGIVFTTVAGIAPTIGRDIDILLNTGQLKTFGQDVAEIVVVLCGSAATICGRVQAGSVYTPDGLPGPNKADFEH